MTITSPSLVPDMPDAVYHADPVEAGSLSSSGAKTILRSPAQYQWEREHRVEKFAYDVGHAVHARVLGVGMPVVEIPDAVLAANGATSTKAAKDFIAEARAAGKVPLKAAEIAPINAMAEKVLNHELARPLLERPGISEASLFAPDPTSGVWLRARPDRLPDATDRRTIIVDLKTARSAYPPDFQRTAAEFGYDIQDAWYRHVLSLVRGDEDPAFVFVVVEVEPPHLVSVIEMDAEYKAVGEHRMRRAIETYRTCREANTWPGYAPVVHTIEPPRWLAYAEEALSA